MDLANFEQRLRELLDAKYHAYAGALATFAYRVGDQCQFITCRWEFSDQRREPRGINAYPNLLLGESWHDGSAALTDLLAITRGEKTLADDVPSLSMNNMHEDPASFGSHTYSGWPELRFTSRLEHPSVPWDPVVHPAYRPYSSGQIAVSEWVWKGAVRSLAGDVPHLGSFLIILPDTRGRIQRAEWIDDRVRISCDYAVDPSTMWLQAVVDEKTSSAMVLAPQRVDGIVEWEIPPGSNDIEVFLVHSDATILGHVRLTSGTRVSATPGGLTTTEQSELDLRFGEGDSIEYKPFIDPKDTKEAEIIETIIAFANTAGGRLYIGVDNDGVPQESAKLRKAGKADIESSLATLIARVRELARERIKPVPQLQIQAIKVFGGELILVEVPRGDSRPYSTTNHDVFIRKGASNLRPDPISELPALYGPTPDHLAATIRRR